MYRRLPHPRVRSLYRRTPTQHHDSPFLFAYARTALKYGIRSLNLVEKDIVLVPEFVCDSVIHPLDQLKLDVRYYPVTDTLEPAWDELEILIADGAHAVLMVHYFGQPQDIQRFRSICDAHKIYLLEDNAHGFSGLCGGGLLGTFGDIGISSPRKSLPILTGGYLYINSDRSARIPDLPLRPLNRLSRSVKLIASSVVDHFPSAFRFLRRMPDYNSQDAFREPGIPDWGMDRSAQLMIESQNPASIRKTRQAIYRVWLEWSGFHQLRPVFPALAPDCAPLVFPAYTKSDEETIKWFEWGWQNDISIHSWPTFPSEILQSKSEAIQYWKRMLCFPIHQQMRPKELENTLSRLTFD